MRLMNVAETPASAVNLGNPVEITIAEIAEQIVALTGSTSQIVYRPLPQDDPRQRCPDIGKARELLHWAPKVALEDGLTRTIAYFEQALSSAPPPVRELDMARAG